MLGGLFVTPTVTAIVEALTSARAEGPIAVVGHARIAAALAQLREVTPVGLPPRAAKKLTGSVAAAQDLPEGSLAAVVGIRIANDDDWAATLAAWSRAVRDGGAIVFVDRGHAPEASRRGLCAGLSELEQRRAGRAVITSGLVTHL